MSSLRAHLSRFSALYVCMLAYALTVVLGNVLYTFPFASDWPAASIPGFSQTSFSNVRNWTFWLLLLAPFVAWPGIAVFVGQSTNRLATTMASKIPEIPLGIYVIMCVGTILYVGYALFTHDALTLFVSPETQLEAIHSRYALLAAMGFKPNIALKAILVFLTVYGVIRFARGDGWRWGAAAILTAIVTAFCLILLNMKWPVVIFIFTIALAVFVASRRHTTIAVVAVTALGAATYLVISTFLMRFVPSFAIETAAADASSASRAINAATAVAGQVAISSFDSAATNIVAAINRMAINVPFYLTYSDFVLDCPRGLRSLWIDRPLSCEPTLRVYAQMFGDDGFVGIGTAPATGSLYWYALDGWLGTALALTLGGLLLGLFSSLWEGARANAIFAAAVTMGGYTGYFVSQLPIEGPVIYDHGMLWWTLLVLLWAALFWGGRYLYLRLFSRRRAPLAQQLHPPPNA